MNFTELSTTLNLIKDQAIAHKEQIGFWLGRTVKPVCEKVLMANPILLTVGLAATAIFSVCYIVHNYRKNSRLEKQVRQLKVDNENNKVSQKRITNLNNLVDSWKQASLQSGNQLQNQKEINSDLKLENDRLIQKLKDESQLHVNSKAQLNNTALKLNNAYVSIQNLEDQLKTQREDSSKTEKDIKQAQVILQTSNDEIKVFLVQTIESHGKKLKEIEVNFTQKDLIIDELKNENAGLINIIQTLNDSIDVSIPTETNFLSDIFFEENYLRQKDQDLILNKSETFLTYRILPTVNKFIVKLDDLMMKVKEDPTRLFTFNINRIDLWSEVEEVPAANPFAEKIEIDKEEADLAGSTLNALTNSMCLGQRPLNLEDLTQIHTYYQKFKGALVQAISEKPNHDYSLEDKLILALEKSKK